MQKALHWRQFTPNEKIRSDLMREKLSCCCVQFCALVIFVLINNMRVKLADIKTFLKKIVSDYMTGDMLILNREILLH